MPRVIGVDIPNNKKTVISLTYIYGIGHTLAAEIVEKLKLNPDKKAKDLTQDEIAKIGDFLQSEHIVEGDLRRQVQGNIKHLIATNTYRGLRHRKGLPVRGQRTRTNARMRKGKRKTIAGKKKAI